MTYEIFICYESSTGEDFAEQLKKALTKAKFKSFLASSDLIAGEEWADERDTALEESQYFIILITYHTLQSNEVMKEYTKATNLKKRIIPCVYSEISSDKAQTLKNKHLINFKNNSELANKILTTIDKIKTKKGIEIEKDIEELWRRGDLLYELNKLEDSLDVFINVSNLNPKFVVPLNNIGVILNRLNRFQEALEYFNRALNINPDLNYVLNNKASSLLGLCKFEEALDLVNNNLVLNPEDGIAWSIKGIILDKLGSNDESKRITEKAFKLNPETPEILNNYALNLVKDGLFKAAIKIYDKALDLNPNFAICWFNKGIAFERLYKFQKALDAFDKALEIDENNENNVDFCNHKGIALAASGRFQEAIELFNRVLRIDTLNLTAISCKALALNDLGDAKNANILIDLALEEDKNNPQVLSAKGKLLNSAQKYDNALQCLNKAEKRGFKPYTLYLDKGFSLLKLNELKDAEKYFSKAIELEPEIADGWYNRGCVYSLMKNKTAALEDLSHSIERNPDFKMIALKDEDFKDMWDDKKFKQLLS
jgi:tetratricopeptide (TPR) repeat protein